MNERFLRGYRVASDDTGMTFLASTYEQGRDGLTITPGAWQLDNFRKNPVFLLSHNYFDPPIGKVTRVEETAKGLVTDVVFDEQDPRAVAIRDKYRGGYMNAVSVGWATLDMDGSRVTRAELLDVSAVSVPGDPNALATARAAFRSLSGAAVVWSRPLDLSGLRDASPAEQERVLTGIRLALINFAAGQVESRVRQFVAEGVRQWSRS